MNNPRSDILLVRPGAAARGWRRPPESPATQVVATGGERSASAGTTVSDEALFLANLPAIDAIVRQVCRRNRLSAVEADDFESEVHLHFIERNYEPLRRFGGRSSLSSYLFVVVQHLFLDYRNRLWGRWRPSADAKRQGPLAILFERLVTRDGRTVDEAIETLRTNHGVDVDDALRAQCVKFAKRGPSRQFVGEVEAEHVESRSAAPDANVLRREQDFVAKRVQTALDRVRQALEPGEQLILKMAFEDDVTVAAIARALQLNQKRLYRTIEKIFDTIQKRLADDGISADDVKGLLAGGAWNQDAEGVRTPWQKS
jgi:RNA polymerase sigma factor for flagellar operon FliA